MKNNEIFNDEVKENLPTKEEILQNEDEMNVRARGRLVARIIPETSENKNYTED